MEPIKNLSTNNESDLSANSKLHYTEEGEFIGIEIDEDMSIEEFLQLAMQVVPDHDEV